MSMQPDTREVAHIDTRLLWDPHTQLVFKAHYFGRLTWADASAAEAGRLIERVKTPDGGCYVFRLTERGHRLLDLPAEAWEKTAMLTITGLLISRSSEYLGSNEADSEIFWTKVEDDPVHEDLNLAFEQARDFWKKKKARTKGDRF